MSFRVAIAVPAQDEVKTAFAYDLAGLMTYTTAQMPDVELRRQFHRGTLLPQQRHDLVDQALVSGLTHILWLDSDMRFPKDALRRLLAHGKDIVAANYATRRPPIQPVAYVRRNGKQELLYTEPESVGVVPVESVGMGVMLTRVSVFEALPLPWFALMYDPDRNVFMGEDLFFCLHSAHHGYSIYVDQDLSKEVFHVGELEYRNEHTVDMRDMLSDGDQTADATV